MEIVKDIGVMILGILTALTVFFALGIGFSFLMHFIGVGASFITVGAATISVCLCVLVIALFKRKAIDKP